MRIANWIFPAGLILTISGVLLSAATSIHNTQDWLSFVLLAAFPTAPFIGTPLMIVGAVLDMRRLPVQQTRDRGLISWAMAVISFLLLWLTGNFHGWTMMWIFPGIAGLIAGAIYMRVIDNSFDREAKRTLADWRRQHPKPKK
jgi:hypothetical protein